ncbi:Homeobox protein onecut [Trichinella britovi]|uniref:Homeobox protein onecut n=1 Tax=Trichinella britovi TaxID=45882 RepID=A0A0V1CGC8_TRIBR|nr:Homeobox protein onecut [Trichinella britovi]
MGNVEANFDAKLALALIGQARKAEEEARQSDLGYRQILSRLLLIVHDAQDFRPMKAARRNSISDRRLAAVEDGSAALRSSSCPESTSPTDTVVVRVDWLIGFEAFSTLTTNDWGSFKLYGFGMTIGKCGCVGRAIVEYLFNFYTMLEQVLVTLRLPLLASAFANIRLPCKRKEEQQQQGIHTPGPKKPRLVFTDIQRRTLQAIFKETKRPSKEMQVTIAQQLGLDVSTVANFFMNARRRGADRWKDNDSNGSRA